MTRDELAQRVSSAVAEVDALPTALGGKASTMGDGLIERYSLPPMTGGIVRPDPNGRWVCYVDHAASLTAARAEIERLRKQHRDFVVSVLRISRDECLSAGPRDAHDDFLAHVKKLRCRAETAEAALEPFADIAGEGDEDFPDDTPVTITFGRTTYYAIKLGDLRAAARIGRSK